MKFSVQTPFLYIRKLGYSIYEIFYPEMHYSKQAFAKACELTLLQLANKEICIPFDGIDKQLFAILTEQWRNFAEEIGIDYAKLSKSNLQHLISHINCHKTPLIKKDIDEIFERLMHSLSPPIGKENLLFSGDIVVGPDGAVSRFPNNYRLILPNSLRSMVIPHDWLKTHSENELKALLVKYYGQFSQSSAYDLAYFTVNQIAVCDNADDAIATLRYFCACERERNQATHLRRYDQQKYLELESKLQRTFHLFKNNKNKIAIASELESSLEALFKKRMQAAMKIPQRLLNNINAETKKEFPIVSHKEKQTILANIERLSRMPITNHVFRFAAFANSKIAFLGYGHKPYDLYIDTKSKYLKRLAAVTQPDKNIFFISNKTDCVGNAFYEVDFNPFSGHHNFLTSENDYDHEPGLQGPMLNSISGLMAEEMIDLNMNPQFSLREVKEVISKIHKRRSILERLTTKVMHKENLNDEEKKLWQFHRGKIVELRKQFPSGKIILYRNMKKADVDSYFDTYYEKKRNSAVDHSLENTPWDSSDVIKTIAHDFDQTHTVLRLDFHTKDEDPFYAYILREMLLQVRYIDDFLFYPENIHAKEPFGRIGRIISVYSDVTKWLFEPIEPYFEILNKQLIHTNIINIFNENKQSRDDENPDWKNPPEVCQSSYSSQGASVGFFKPAIESTRVVNEINSLMNDFYATRIWNLSTSFGKICDRLFDTTLEQMCQYAAGVVTDCPSYFTHGTQSYKQPIDKPYNSIFNNNVNFENATISASNVTTPSLGC